MNDKSKPRSRPAAPRAARPSRSRGGRPGASARAPRRRTAPRSPRAAGRARDTEARLIEGALFCLRERGLRGTSSRAIAAAAGINLGGITYHFGSKDELVSRALLAAIRGWIDPVLEILRADMDPIMRLVAAVQTLQTSYEQAREMLPVYLEALVLAPRNDTLRRGVEELFGELRTTVTRQLREQKDAGTLPAWVEPEAMATLFIAAGDGIALHTALEANRIDHHAVASQAMQLLLAARDRR